MQLSKPKFIFAIRSASNSPLHNNFLANDVAPCNIVAKSKRDKMKLQHDGSAIRISTITSSFSLSVPCCPVNFPFTKANVIP